MLATGARSQQFVLQNTRFEPNYEGNPNTVKVVGGTLVHYTIAEIVKSWQLNTATFSNLVSGTVYYIYAPLPKDRYGRKHRFRYSTAKGRQRPDILLFPGRKPKQRNNRHRRKGGRRVLLPLLMAQRPLTDASLQRDVFRTGDGNTYIDLDNNQFRIGNANRAIEYNVNNSGAVKITNATVELKNTSGQTMVYFSGTDGSGQLAKGNITWDKDGNLKAKGGIFTDVKISGSLRKPVYTSSRFHRRKL